MKLKIYFKGDKNNYVTMKMDSEKNREAVKSICDGEIQRKKVLKELDYPNKYDLVFKIGGQKVSLSTVIDLANGKIDSFTAKSAEKKKGKKKKKEKIHYSVDENGYKYVKITRKKK